MKKRKSEGVSILEVPMDPETNDAEATSIKDYLICLLSTLWYEDEGFSGKRPFGNSGWQYELYASLIKAGKVKGSLDEYGHVEDVNQDLCHELIVEAINAL